ncbi:precorrin-6y C5,15-methyltransferase (decarboxylating) subunit CbiE [Gordonia sp. ABSL11-1]|uniref:precorrin-6y C5,15-methyltransferase (decarboxylating) subunit CbiE n=1 Tax=Gordonia sp. ABSL11-1 TaxID=3053924 RepID=UPI0025737D56|nr:precorrin-6y C5,15-methyltransferase (decarboxylating) subunit CbiE [Gordonia sp. ABSL11-1]MDL9948477.1 precorrin-6y C5,15-methyltransferase (decarboxylating) subunit CbiE [Gordonia sp. ABSL11-1]
MLISDVHLVVVGIGADGWSGLAESSRAPVLAADVLLGSDRQLALIPPVRRQVRESWPAPLRDGLPAVLQRFSGRKVVALASGDPMLSGIGTTLVELLGQERVTVLPAVSSIALARARLGWSAESAGTVSVVGRDVARVLRELAPGRRLLILSSDKRTPGVVRDLLVGLGYGRSRFVVLGDLGAPSESRVDSTADEFDGAAGPLNIIALELSGPVVGGWTSGLPDELFVTDGQITRRDIRASALARLSPLPGQLLWDVGAGAGSVGIEWMRAHSSCRTIAVEVDPERVERIAVNARRLGVPDVQVIRGKAPDALSGLPRPHAIFVGGGATRPGVLDTCRESLLPGGRLVVHGVTLETEMMLGEAYRAHGGELARMSVERAAPVGAFTGWSPARTIVQWSWTRPGQAR